MTRRILLRHTARVAGAVRLGLLVLPVLAGVAWQAPSAQAQPAAPSEETWYVYRIAGQNIGHIHETIRNTGGAVTTTTETLVIIQRLGIKVEIKGLSEFVESSSGQLQSARSEMSSSRQTTKLEAAVEKGRVVLHISTGGKDYRRELPYSGEIVGPWGIRQASARGLKSKGDVVACQTLVPELERLTKVTRKLLEVKVPLAFEGTNVACTRVEARLEGFPGVSSEWLNPSARLLRQTKAGPFGETEVLATDRGTALNSSGGNLSNKLFAESLLHSNIRLPAPRFLDRLVVRLGQKDPSLGWPDFAAAGQTILRREGQELSLEVKQLKADASVQRPVRETQDLREYLAPNAILQSDDAEVQRIAHEVAGGEKDSFRAACRLRDWVSDNMQMDLGIAMTPASESIRQRKGTCAAYAITLASLARAAGIPSRVVMGYAYVAGIWGGHAWVEVWTGRWTPLDGALPSPGVADAARIACVETSFAEGAGPLTSALARVFGNLRVAIVEFDLDGRVTKVPHGAAPFAIDGDIYRNPWLGLVVQKPTAFRFARTDAVYPDSTVVAIESASGQRVDLRQSQALGAFDEEAASRLFHRFDINGKPRHAIVAGQSAFAVDEGTKAGLAFREGPELWVLTAEGEHAGDLVRQTSAMITFRRPPQ